MPGCVVQFQHSNKKHGAVPAAPLLDPLLAAASFTLSAAADFLGAFASNSSFKGLVWERKSYHLVRCGSFPDLRIFSHCKLAVGHMQKILHTRIWIIARLLQKAGRQAQTLAAAFQLRLCSNINTNTWVLVSTQNIKLVGNN